MFSSQGVLALLAGTTVRRKEKFSRFNETSGLSKIDEELDSTCPFFDQFHKEAGGISRRDFINFTASEIERNLVVISEFLKKDYNIRSGRERTVSREKMVLTLMKTLQHEVLWDVLGRVFKISGPTFEGFISRVAMFISGFVYCTLLTEITDYFSMN